MFWRRGLSIRTALIRGKENASVSIIRHAVNGELRRYFLSRKAYEDGDSSPAPFGDHQGRA